jgi:hypothetical protein
MKSLRSGEKIIDSYLLNCKYGKANLVLTNFQIMIENSRGIILELEHKEVVDLRLIDSKSVKMSWMEGVNSYYFTFKSDEASKIAYNYALVRQNCSG